MPTVKVYNMAGQETGELELNAAISSTAALSASLSARQLISSPAVPKTGIPIPSSFTSTAAALCSIWVPTISLHLSIS